MKNYKWDQGGWEEKVINNSFHRNKVLVEVKLQKLFFLKLGRILRPFYQCYDRTGQKKKNFKFFLKTILSKSQKYLLIKVAVNIDEVADSLVSNLIKLLFDGIKWYF